VKVWQRTAFSPGGGPGDLWFFVFADSPLLGLKLSASRHGWPAGHAVDGFDISLHSKAEHPERFDGLIEQPLVWDADATDYIEALRQATYRITIRAVIDDPPDLAHLQCAMALVRAVAEGRGIAICDAHAISWMGAEKMAAEPVDMAFDVSRHMSVVFETESNDGIGHIVHTRGLTKFGRSDLILLDQSPASADYASTLLYAVANFVAHGASLTPGQTMQLGDAGEFRFEEYVPGDEIPELYLNNAGLVLRPL